MIQLNPVIPVITPKGKGFAHFVTDMGIEHHLLWTVFQDDTGECWTWSNPEIRIQNNITIGRNVKPLYIQENQIENQKDSAMKSEKKVEKKVVKVEKELKKHEKHDKKMMAKKRCG